MAVTETGARAARTLDDLYRRHVSDIYRYAYAVLGNHADAEDVTQTTFVNALRSLERGEEPRDPGRWLLVIAHNIVRQRWRQAKVRPTEVELVYDVRVEPRGDDDRQLDDLVRALQRIPPAQREAIVMRELEGRSYQEISELLGMSNGALETLLFRARRSLAEEMENLVTCDRAELSLSRQLDGRLSRKERRRLDDHLRECSACARVAESQKRHRRAFKGLAVLPIPVGLTLFKGAPAAGAAALPTIGLAAAGTGAGSLAGGGALAGGAASGGAASAAGVLGGTLLTGATAKIAVVIAAASVATGVGVKTVEKVQSDAPKHPARAATAPGPSKSAGTAVSQRSSRTTKNANSASAAARNRGATRRSDYSRTHSTSNDRPTSAPGHTDAANNGRSTTVPGHAGTANYRGSTTAPGQNTLEPTTKPDKPDASTPGPKQDDGNAKAAKTHAKDTSSGGLDTPTSEPLPGEQPEAPVDGGTGDGSPPSGHGNANGHTK